MVMGLARSRGTSGSPWFFTLATYLGSVNRGGVRGKGRGMVGGDGVGEEQGDVWLAVDSYLGHDPGKCGQDRVEEVLRGGERDERFR